MSSAPALKKIYYCAALIPLISSCPLYGVGLGEMHNTPVLMVAPEVEQGVSTTTDFIAPIGRLSPQNGPGSEFLKKSDDLLKKQLNLFQEQQVELQAQLEKRDKDVEIMRQQLKLMLTHTGTIAKTSNNSDEAFSSSWLIRLGLLLSIAAGGSYWYFTKSRAKKGLKPDTVPTPLSIKDKPVEETPNVVNKVKPSASKVDVTDELSEKTADPLKSKKAYKTLIELAKTYVSMADFESARQALEEVQEQGTPSQQQEATAILLQIQDRKN